MKDDRYGQHFLMDTETVKEYAKDGIGYFQAEEELEAEEIGDGNINYVFRVWNPLTGRSLVIKQADRYLRSSGRPLALSRNRIEASILKIEGRLAPGCVPEIYHYDEDMCALAMEDISAYKNLRTELLRGKTFPHLAQSLSGFLAKTLLPTTDLVMNPAEKKQWVRRFINPELCDISEDLVFTEPYNNYKGRNVVLPEQLGFVERFLYQDEELKAEAAKLRDRFMNCAQALVHGDLHTGSVFVSETGIQVIDPEFAFYGPMGYDVGNIIGNLFFAWANKFYTEPGNREFLSWIEQTVKDTVDGFLRRFREACDAQVAFPLYRNAGFRQDYTAGVLADSIGYAGTEIIRRVVGDSKVADITGVADKGQRILMERALIKCGTALIRRRAGLKDGGQITELFQLILA